MSPPKPTLDDLRIERKDPARSQSRVWLWVLLIVVALGATGAVFLATAQKALPVRTALARETSQSAGKSERTVLNASGYVTARRQATVSSKVTGKVVEVLIEEGMKVQEGQVLAKLDDTNVRTSLDLAQAQLKSAQAALAETRVRIKEAELNYKRIADLAKSRISAQADLEHAEADEQSLQAKLVQQQADVSVADRAVAAWQQQLDDTIIRAPFGGVVTSKNAQPGEMISPISAGGGFTRTGICTIVDMASLEIETDVNESFINRVETGQPADAMLDAYPDWKIPCKVIAIIPSADRQKSTVKVRVGFDKLDPRILPEMSIKVAFRENAASEPGSAANRVLSIPRAAVQQDEGRDVVWVVQSGRAERRAVTLAGTTSDEAVVAAGVSPGEKVVVEGAKGLSEGAHVRETKP